MAMMPWYFMTHLQFPAKKTKQASCFDSLEAGGKKSFQTVRLVLGEVVAQRLYRKWRWFLQILYCVDAQIWRAALNCDLHRYQSLSRKRRSWLVLLWHSDSDSTTCGWFKTSNLNKCSSWQSREVLASKLGTCFLLDLFSKSETSRYLAKFLATSMHLVFYWSGSLSYFLFFVKLYFPLLSYTFPECLEYWAFLLAYSDCQGPNRFRLWCCQGQLEMVLLRPLRSGIVVLLHGVAAVCTEYVFQVEGLSRVGCQSTSINTFPFQCKTGVLEALPLDSSILLYNVSWCNTLQTTWLCHFRVIFWLVMLCVCNIHPLMNCKSRGFTFAALALAKCLVAG